jgi:hypothetical protein
VLSEGYGIVNRPFDRWKPFSLCLMDAIFLFETLLFHNNTPCYYKIFLAGDVYIGEPTPHHYYSRTSFPHFLVRRSEGGLTVEGLQDSRMIRQIREELDRHLSQPLAQQ